MGLDIKVLKPLEKVEKDSLSDDIAYIYTLDFPPFKHLTKFDEGYYKVERIESPQFHMPYGAFNDFRRWIAKEVCGMSMEKIWKMEPLLKIYAEQGERLPFTEFFYFADNEGCFDYVVAENLYDDFVTDRKKMSKTNSQYMPYYDIYMEILRIAAENKAVVYYY